MIGLKKQKILVKNIEELGLSDKIINTLRINNILLIEDVWKLKRKDLKAYGLSDSDISQIIIKLQLFGLDLGKKIY